MDELNERQKRILIAIGKRGYMGLQLAGDRSIALENTARALGRRGLATKHQVWYLTTKGETLYNKIKE